MTQTLDTLTQQVRLESGLYNNQVILDQQIYTLLSEAYSDLRDRLIARFAYWFRREVLFTLSGGTSGYIFDLSTIPDFQMAQGLDLVVSDGIYMTIPMLGSFAERNAFNGLNPFLSQPWGYNATLGRKYWIDGDRLEVLPPQNSSGNYRLVYTPIETMAAPVLQQTVTAITSDDVANVGGYVRFDLNGLTVTSDMLGGSISVNYAAPNDVFNGTYAISPSTPVGAHYVQTLTPWNPALTWTGPTSGTVNVNVNGPNSVYLLPDKLTPWSQYMVLYAALAVRNTRQQDSQALSLRFADIKQRVIDLTKQRSEGVRQAPLTSGRYNKYGSWYGVY